MGSRGDRRGNALYVELPFRRESLSDHTQVYDLEFLHKFAMTFSSSPLTDFIDDYCRWFKLPLPEPDEELSISEAPVEVSGESKSTKKARGFKKVKAGMNARERRKTRRLAGKEGVLAEDLDREERDELVSSMTVSYFLNLLCQF